MNFKEWESFSPTEFVGYIIKKNLSFEHAGLMILFIVLVESSFGQGPLV